MTSHQLSGLEDLMAALQAFHAGGSGVPYVSIDSRRLHVEEQFERYGLDMCDIYYMFRQQDVSVVPHLATPGDLFEIRGVSVDGDQMVVVACVSGLLVKVLNVWL